MTLSYSAPSVPSSAKHHQAHLPTWFVAGGFGLGFASYLGAGPNILFVVALALALLTSRDVWQTFLVLTLASLALATTGADVSIEQPYLLRFALLSVLVLLQILQYPIIANLNKSRVLFTGTIAMAGFLVWTVVSALTGSFTTVALEASLAATMTLAVPITAALGRWREPGRMIADLFVMLRFLWLLAMIGLGIGLADGLLNRSTGLHANPNTFAFLCALGFGLSLGLRLLLNRSSGVLLLTTFGFGVLITGSRGALAGALLAVAYLTFRRASQRRSRLVAVAIGAVVAILFVAPVPSGIDPGDVVDRTFGGEELDLGGRQDRWSDMRVLINEQPFTGHGLRTSSDALQSTAERGLTASAGAHNSYLTMAAETGLIGAALLLLLLFGVLRLKPPHEHYGTVAWIAASGAVVTGLGHMFGESFIFGVGSPFPLIFWSSVVVLLAVGSRSNSGVTP